MTFHPLAGDMSWCGLHSDLLVCSVTLTSVSDHRCFPGPHRNASTLPWVGLADIHSFIQQIFIESLLCTNAHLFCLLRDTYTLKPRLPY